MKHLKTILLCAVLACAMVLCATLIAYAGDSDPKTVVVSSKLTDADGTTKELTIGGKTYNVTIGKDGFAKAQDAFDAVAVGGTVVLDEGIYSEGVEIRKDVNVKGPKAGIDPSVRGQKATDDWTRSAERGTGEAILKTSWHVGVVANKAVFDCHNVTFDGLMVSGGGMFRSNYGEEGYITINYKNILVAEYNAGNNGPFYCVSYYPDKTKNLYKRNISMENIRFEGMKAPGCNPDADTFNAKGIYFDNESTAKFFSHWCVSDSTKYHDAVEINIEDSMFRNKTNQILNVNFSDASGGYKFNVGIGNREKVTVNIKNNVFANNDSGAATNNNIIVPQIYSENVYFNITGNIFYMENKASDNLIAIHGATAALPLGEKVKITGNRFIGIPTALNMTKSTTEFDLSGNYFEDGDKVPGKPVVVGPDKTEWWYMDYDMKTTSKAAGSVFDAVLDCGTVDADKLTMTDTVTTSSYTFKIKTSSFNKLEVFGDKGLKEALTNPVTLHKKENVFYVKLSSNDGTVSKVYTATIKTSNPDTLTLRLGRDVRFFGRTYSESGTYFFNWSASGFEFKFKGSGAKATIVSSAPGNGNNAFIKIFIDGVEQPDVELTGKINEVTLASGLDKDKEHTIMVLKRTNGRSSSAGVSDIKLTDGTVLEAPKAKTRLIEFIGDSITVGYATLGKDGDKWSTSTEDVTKTYIKMIAEAFGADYMVTAISGRGVVRNTGGDTDKLMPDIYKYLDIYNNPGVDYDFERQPDVIVINLGTNDSSGSNPNLTAAEFEAGLKAFLLDVRAKNPKAEIIYAYGFMTTKFKSSMQKVIKELNDAGDKNISFMALKTCLTSERCIGHPTAAAYVSRGEAIIEQISKTTGWEKGSTGETTDTESQTDTDTKAPDTDSDTVAPDTGKVTEPSTNEPSTEKPPKNEKGCKSTVISAVAMVAVSCAAAVALKKKED